MGDKSAIEWTDATWNPLAAFDRETGKRGWFCTKVSDGCTNCYAEAMNRHRGTGHLYRHKHLPEVEIKLVMMDKPRNWTRPRMIFVNSMTDIAGEFVTDEQILQIWTQMAECPWHIFQVLTKRMDRLCSWLKAYQSVPLPNVWIGTSVEHQEAANERIPELLDTPAAVRWLSCEPLLGPVDLTHVIPRDDSPGEWHMNALDCDVDPEDDPFRCATIDWVVVGGESGHHARPMHPDWARSIRDQCIAAAVPFHFKQWGAWREVYDRDREDPDWRQCSRYEKGKGRWLNLVGGHGFHGERVLRVVRRGKKYAGRMLDGREWNQQPRDVDDE